MKCWICGKEDASETCERDYVRFTPYWYETEEEKRKNRVPDFEKRHCARHFCEQCYKERNKELSNTRAEYARLKKKLMLERAVRILEKQAVNMYDYKEIIDDMAVYVEEFPDKFDSTYEMIAAIILVSKGIASQMQYKIGKYRADFFIPEYKIVLEIDGELHKNNLFRDNQRDIEVRKILGADWETVRIGTKYLDQNAQALVKAMLTVKYEKQKIRKEHHGFLPEWYSARDKARKAKQIKTADDEFFDVVKQG